MNNQLGSSPKPNKSHALISLALALVAIPLFIVGVILGALAAEGAISTEIAKEDTVGIIVGIIAGLAVICSFASIVTGALALFKSIKNPAQFGGKAFAIAGMLISVGIIFLAAVGGLYALIATW